jgi:putative protease
VRRLGSEGRPVEADWGLNVVNPWSANALAGLGATAVWASTELSGRQIASLVAGSRVPVGVVVAGHLELMVAEHCVLQAAGACSHDCVRCRRRREPFALRDRKGYVFPVTTDATGRAHIYNSVTLDLSRAMKEVVASGISAIRLDLHLETPAEAAALVRAYRGLLQDVAAERRPPDAPLVSPSTSGHFFRGLS